MGWATVWLMVFTVLTEKGLAEDRTKILDQVMDINKGKPTCQVDPAMAYVCDSMSLFSCKQGTFEDGTGQALSADDYQKKITPIESKLVGIYEKSILKVLENPDTEFDLVRELAIKGTGQNGTPGCELEKESGKRECFKRVASILASRKARAELGSLSSGGESRSSSQVDFDALFSLSQNSAFKAATGAAHKEALEVLTDGRMEKKIEKKIFPKVREIFIGKIKETVADPVLQKRIVQKLQNVRFEGVDCTAAITEDTKDEGQIPGLLVSNAFYEPQSQSVRFCNGFLLKNNSEFAVSMILAHELAHSIDPCNIQKPKGAAVFDYGINGHTHQELEDKFPIPGVLSCLRTNESVGAVMNQSDKEMKAGSVAFCNRNDQIREAFCDWMGSEVLGTYIDENHSNLSPKQKLVGYSNAFRNLGKCGVSEDDFDAHPTREKRTDRILMANPEIRAQIGCPAAGGDPHYCRVGEKFLGTRAVLKKKETSDSETEPSLKPSKGKKE